MKVSFAQIRDSQPALFDQGCGTRVILDHIMSKWGVLVLSCLSDGTRRWVTVGLGYTPSDSMAFDLGYGHIFVNDAQISTRTATGNSLNGSYDSSGNLLGASAQFRF